MDWVWLDPVVSLLIAAIILWGTWDLFKQSLHLLFDGVPDSVDTLEVRKLLLALAVLHIGLTAVAGVDHQHVHLPQHLEAGHPLFGDGQRGIFRSTHAARFVTHCNASQTCNTVMQICPFGATPR